jgi:hypothetical protein
MARETSARLVYQGATNSVGGVQCLARQIHAAHQLNFAWNEDAQHSHKGKQWGAHWLVITGSMCTVYLRPDLSYAGTTNNPRKYAYAGADGTGLSLVHELSGAWL